MIKKLKEIYCDKQKITRMLLLSIFLIVLTFFCVRVFQFTRDSLQRDFSAYYTAGASLNHGLSPYVNNYQANPPIWDGVNNYKNSRFLYPPLVANFFQPLALMPYQTAKVVWTIINLAAIFFSVLCVVKMLVKDKSQRVNLFLLSAIGVCLFFPVITYFERGQIDGITLFFLIRGIQYLSEGKSFRSGFFLAFPMLIKINIIIILPIFMIKKYRKAIPSLLIMFGLFLLLTVSLNKWGLVKDYVTSDFSRILKYKQYGVTENIIPSEELIAVNGGYPLTNPHIQGVGYMKEYFKFAANGSLTRTILAQEFDQRLVDLLPFSLELAVCFLLYLFSFCLCAILIFTTNCMQHTFSELLLWGLVLTIILLISPLTWVMNLVWLVILLPIFFTQAELLLRFYRKKQIFSVGITSIVIGLIGLLLIAFDDTIVSTNSITIARLMANKYPLGELLVSCWLIISIVFYRSLYGPLVDFHKDENNEQSLSSNKN